MNTLCSDMLLSLCSFLDDISYIHLWITCKRYCVLLRSEIFLRTLFRDRNASTLSLTDLRRGFKNIIKNPTITLFKDQKLINHYRYANDRFIFDIFERLWIIEADKLRDSGLIVQVKRVVKIIDLDYYYFLSHNNELIITNEQLEPITIFINVDNCLSQTKMLLFRQEGQYKIYIPGQELILMVECFLPHTNIKSTIVTLSNDGEQSIGPILDNDGRLIVEHKVVARNVKTMNALDDVIAYVTNDNDYCFVVKEKIQVAARDVKYYARVGTCHLLFVTNTGACYTYLDSHTTLICEKGVITGKRIGWNFANTQTDLFNKIVPNGKNVVHITQASHTENSELYHVVRYKALY